MRQGPAHDIEPVRALPHARDPARYESHTGALVLPLPTILYFDEKLPLEPKLSPHCTDFASGAHDVQKHHGSIGFPIQHTNAYHDVLEFFADDNVYAVRKLRTGSSARVNLTDIDLCENVPSKLYVRMRHLNGTITRPACGPFSLAQLTTSTQECDFRVPTARVSLFNATYGSHPVRWTSLPLIPARADRILSNQMKDVFSYAHFTLYEDTITEESSYVFYDTQNGAPRWSPETATAAAVYPTVMYRFDVRHPKQVPYFAYEGFLEQRQEISLRTSNYNWFPFASLVETSVVDLFSDTVATLATQPNLFGTLQIQAHASTAMRTRATRTPTYFYQAVVSAGVVDFADPVDLIPSTATRSLRR